MSTHPIAIRLVAIAGVSAGILISGAGCFTCPKGTEVEPDAIRELVARIDETPHRLHGDFTPAVDALSEMGPQVIPYVLPLMESTNWPTRLHAVRVMHFTTMGMYCFARGRGWPDDRSARRWAKFWNEMGPLRYDGPDGERAHAIQKWRDWLHEHRIYAVQPSRAANRGAWWLIRTWLERPT